MNRNKKGQAFMTTGNCGTPAFFEVVGDGDLRINLEDEHYEQAEGWRGVELSAILGEDSAVSLRDFLNRAYPIEKKQEAKQ